MPTRFANAKWSGSVENGSGTTSFGDFAGNFSAGSRFEDADGTNPEQLLGAAHASCFSMALSLMLGEEGFRPEQIDTDAEVTIKHEGEDIYISEIVLKTEATVPEIDDETFQSIAEHAKEGCPVSAALTGVDIELEARLLD
jgi:osmotically inducible protein OsmC